MSLDLALVLAMLAVAISMFVLGRPRMDAVALLVLVAMPFTGVVTMNEALSGFADPTIILIAALFVIGEGLVRTGVARRLGDWLDTKAGSSENRLVVLLMAAVGGLGSLMSSTAVVAIFIPVVLRISSNRRMSPGRLMMPLSVAALISGMLTLVATAPNLVVSAELVRQGMAGFGFFSFTPFGLPVLGLGILYMLVTRRLLASTASNPATTGARPDLRRWIEQYSLADREMRVRIETGSPLDGKRIDELPLQAAGVNLLAVERTMGFRTEVLRPAAQTVLRPGDVLLADIQVPTRNVDALWRSLQLEPRPFSETGNYFIDRSQEIGMVEVIVPPDSKLVGQTVRRANIPLEYNLSVIGLRHGSKVVAADLLEERIKVGDTLLLVGFWPDIRTLQSDPNDVVVLNMPVELEEVLPSARRAPQALAVLGLVIALMVSGLVPNVQAALIGCLLMGTLGCVDFNSAYRSVNWKTLVLIVGMLPFSLALERTGGIDLAAHALVELMGDASPRLLLMALFAVTAGLGLFISNTATAVLMAPVALAIARDTGVSPYPFAMCVALAASTAFVTPISSPVNTLVVGPGQYSFSDFVKVGLPFSIIVALVSVLLIPLLLPF